MNQKRIISILLAFIAFSIMFSGTASAAPTDQDFEAVPIDGPHASPYTLAGVDYSTNCISGPNIYIDSMELFKPGTGQALYSVSNSGTTEVTFETTDGSEFKLNSFVISRVIGDLNVAIVGYRNGIEVVSDPSIDIDPYTTFDVSANPDWENIDKVVIFGNNLDIFIDDIDFSPAVLPTYTVTYNGNTNTSGSVPIDENTYFKGDMVTVLGNTGSLVKDGYTFAGWNTQTGGGGDSYYGADTFTMGSSNVTLYAQWDEIPAPVADFTSNTTSGTLPLSVSFTDQSTNNPVSWLWEFGDGNTSTEQDPTHTYSNAGTYNVNLTATNAGGSNTTSVTDYITVIPKVPVSNFNSNVTSGALPLSVDFNDLSLNNPTGWTWYFGDEDISQTWTLMNSGTWNERDRFSSAVLPDGSILIMGGYDSGVYLRDVWRSTNNGTTWTQMASNTAWDERNGHSSVALSNGTVLLMGGHSGGFQSTVYRSDDNGATWAQVTTSGSMWPGRELHTSVVLPDDSIVVMGGYNGAYLNDVWRSTDAGVSWTQMNASAWPARKHHSSAVLPDGSIVVMGGSGGTRLDDVWRSIDNGATWEQMTDNAEWGARYMHNSVALPDGSIMLMGGDNGVYLRDVWRSIDNGATWTEVSSSSAWTARGRMQTEVLPDGSVLLMGGSSSDSNQFSDVYRLTTASSIEQNPVHTYNEVGTYQVTLQAYNSGGYNNSIKAGYITVAVEPISNFTSNVTSGVNPLSVVFTDLSENEPTSWEWNFGDGSTSTEQNPTHTYSETGTYNVSLNVSNIGGSNNKTVNTYITVADIPVANFTSNVTSGALPLTVSFSDLSTNGPTAWEWDFGDGTNTTGQNQTHTYLAAGTYTVSLNASNVGGSNVTTMTGYITVNAPEEESSSSSSSSSRRSIPVSQPSDIVASTHSSMQRVLGGSSVEYDLSQTESPVVSIKFDAKDNAGLVVASVQVLSDSPDNTPAPASDSYQLLSIDVGKQGTISSQNAENILINFRVSREWILENNLNPATIRMARYHEGEWEDLPTDRTDEDDDFLYFVAETQGFSIFSVVGDEVKTTTEEETPVTAEFAEDEPKESAPAEDKSTPGFSAVMGLVFVTVAFLIVRKFN